MRYILSIFLLVVMPQSVLGTSIDEETNLYKEVAAFFEETYKGDIKDLPQFALEEYNKYLQSNSLKILDDETAFELSNNKKIFTEVKPLFNFWKIYLSIEVVESQVPGIEINYEKQKLVISSTLINICGLKGVVALAAHEMAHILFVNASRQLKSLLIKGDKSAIRELKKIEFCCDAVAYYSLKRLGFDTNALTNSFSMVDLYVQNMRLDNNSSNNQYNYHPRTSNRIALLKLLNGK